MDQPQSSLEMMEGFTSKSRSGGSSFALPPPDSAVKPSVVEGFEEEEEAAARSSSRQRTLLRLLRSLETVTLAPPTDLELCKDRLEHASPCTPPAYMLSCLASGLEWKLS